MTWGWIKGALATSRGFVFQDLQKVTRSGNMLRLPRYIARQGGLAARTSQEEHAVGTRELGEATAAGREQVQPGAATS